MKTPKQINELIQERDSLKAQLTDANETIRQNRLTIERLQEMVNQKLLVKPDMYPIGQDFREIALNLSRHLVQTSQSFEDKYSDQ